MRIPFLWKRLIDGLGAAFLSTGAIPALLLLILYVKLLDPRGRAIIAQVRVGQHGRLFTMFKLRTMRIDAEPDRRAVLAGRGDPRILPGCRWIRRTHLDELPQLWNVLRGEMSLVGPRPERPQRHEQLVRDVPGFERRLAVKPGITGLAQLYNGYDTDLPSITRKLEYDLQYIRRMGLLLDALLLAATLTRLVDRGAH